jgi:V/A-type H+-transporting ATPase subunit I
VAIVPLQRFTLIGELKHRDRTVLELQQLGCVHVLDRSGAEPSTEDLKDYAGDLKSAIDYLERTSDKRPPPSVKSQQPLLEKDEAKRIAEEVLEIKNQSRLLAEEQEAVSEAIELTKPWGDFRWPADDALGNLRLFFFRLTHRQAARAQPRMQQLTAQRINSDQQYEYWLVIATARPQDMPGEEQTLDSRSLSELQKRLAEVETLREQLQVKRIALTRWIDHLRNQLATLQDETSRLIAAHRAAVDGPLFVLDGWVPRPRADELETFSKSNTLALRIRAPRASDQPPTLLSNPSPIAGAEGAVTFFMTPGYRAWDPTWVMYFSFSLFFAMILADAGYGLVLAVILGFLARPLGRTQSGRRFRQLAVFMVLVTIVYGVIVGSFFGIGAPEGSWLDRLVIKSAGRTIMEDREAMMLVATTIGVLHLVLANAIVAWRWLGSGHALSSVGWMLALIGGWMLAVAKLPRPETIPMLANVLGRDTEELSFIVTQSGWYLLIGGFVLVFLFSSIRPVFSLRPIDWLMRCVDGVMGLTGVTKAFGDTLSYLRLFALGLASAQLAIVFNQLASDVSQVRGVGLLLGLLIFLLGHTLNLLLAVVGGVVHGLRLNCIEFFSWSLTDEGQPFETFEMKADQ